MDQIIIVLNFGLTLVLLIVSSVSFCKLMKNDLTHLSEDVKEIKSDVKDLQQRVANIEGKLNGI